MKIEYKVREVKRYVVTRFEESDCGKTGSSSVCGNFDNYQTAYHVGNALADAEGSHLGYAPGDMRMIYPSGIPEGHYPQPEEVGSTAG